MPGQDLERLLGMDVQNRPGDYSISARMHLWDERGVLPATGYKSSRDEHPHVHLIRYAPTDNYLFGDGPEFRAMRCEAPTHHLCVVFKEEKEGSVLRAASLIYHGIVIPLESNGVQCFWYGPGGYATENAIYLSPELRKRFKGPNFERLKSAFERFRNAIEGESPFQGIGPCDDNISILDLLSRLTPTP